MTDYPRFHRDPVNLLVHIVAVPVFVAGAVGAVAALATARWTLAALCAASVAVSIAAQGLGHRREENPPLPFAGPGDFARRILSEQFYRFWAFVLGGEWGRAVRGRPPL